MLLQEKQKKRKKQYGKKAPKPHKVVFLRWSSRTEKNEKHGFLAKLPDTNCVKKGEKRIFVYTICFGPKFFLDQNSENQEEL